LGGKRGEGGLWELELEPHEAGGLRGRGTARGEGDRCEVRPRPAGDRATATHLEALAPRAPESCVVPHIHARLPRERHERAPLGPERGPKELLAEGPDVFSRRALARANLEARAATEVLDARLHGNKIRI
jgi:hypothetical protein